MSSNKTRQIANVRETGLQQMSIDQQRTLPSETLLTRIQHMNNRQLCLGSFQYAKCIYANDKKVATH